MMDKYKVKVTLKSGKEITFDEMAHINGFLYDSKISYHDFVTGQLFNRFEKAVISIVKDMDKINDTYYFLPNEVSSVNIYVDIPNQVYYG